MNYKTNQHPEPEITKRSLAVSALLVLAVLIIAFIRSQH
jgi:hypothetical protein